MSRTAALAAALAVACTFAATAVGREADREHVKLTAAGQAAARAAVLRRADFAGSGWVGGRAKADLPGAGPSCGGYRPKQSDLVLTGIAKSEFSGNGFQVTSEAQVLKTRRMVALDWQRTVLAPGMTACLRSSLAKSFGSRAKLVSFAQLAFPRLGPYARAYRAVVDVHATAGTVRLLSDLVLVGRSRTEVTLSLSGAAQAKAVLARADRAFARLSLKRIRA